MREVLEEVITHASGVDPATREAVHQYTKLFWLNTGPFNNLTARKFVMKTTPAAFAAGRGGRGQGRGIVPCARWRDGGADDGAHGPPLF